MSTAGAHTIGRVRCQIITGSTILDTDISAEYRAKLAKACDPLIADPLLTLQNLDLKTPNKFDNNYFKNLRRAEGILPSDQTLQSTPGLNVDIVKDYAQNKEIFSVTTGSVASRWGT